MRMKFSAIIRYAWLTFVIAWYESEIRRFDREIAKQERILGRYS